MQKTIHRAETRGHIDHGWFDTYNTFSFAGYENPERSNFGMLRVLNDDMVVGGGAFGTHLHRNMELITIMLEGTMEHKDDKGGRSVLSAGDVHILSAGAGMRHTEKNVHPDKPMRYLRMWVIPNKMAAMPRCDQTSVDAAAKKDTLFTVVSPEPKAQRLQINQEASLHLGDLSKGWKTQYLLQKESAGMYVFVLNGHVMVGGEILKQRDGIGIHATGKKAIPIEAITQTEIVVMEFPMD
jgi:redox-sensitive bicupin YhaK (pirin superfamily)